MMDWLRYYWGVWRDEWVSMMEWRGSSVMYRCSMMNWSTMGNSSSMMNRGNMMYRGSMMNRCSMMDRSSMMNWCRMVNWCMMNRCCMMNWCRMVSNMMYCGMMRIRMMRWDWFSIFIQLWFGVVRVLMRISIQLVQGNSLATVHLVPKLTSKLVLVKKSPIRADKAGSCGSISTIIANSVGLAS